MEVNMKPYLIDVPVLLFVFVRPGTLQCVFDIIKEARPSKLFLVSDGSRPDNPTDMARIVECRSIVEEIDWECSVYHYYHYENQGLYNMVREALDWVFTYVDRCIFLEDDVVPSLSFFRYCAELLERYKDDLRVNMICGMNHLGVYNEPNTDYFFSGSASIWGFALWRRTYKAFYDDTYGKDNYILDRIKENAKGYKDFVKALEGYYRDAFYGGHIAGPEFYLRFIISSQNKVNILPKYNMIKNIGFGEGSTHAANDLRLMPKGVQKMFQMKTYEYTFPLKHPSYLVADKKFEKKVLRIVARNYPFIVFYRKCEGFLRRIYFKRDTLFENICQNRSRIVVCIITFLMILCGLLIFILKNVFRKLMRFKNNI
jgi:hypothetical protein